METTINQRIKQFVEKKGLKVRAFERMCGLSNGYVLGIKNTIMPNKLSNISQQFPELNIGWLLTGEGDMLKSVPDTVTEETRPMIPSTVAAGTLNGFADGIKEYDCEMKPVNRSFPDYDFTILVRGDSMEPKYEGGDEIAIKKIFDAVEWGKVYVLDTRDGAVVKRLYDSGDKYRCVSYNTEYPDFEVKKDDVFGVYRVVGMLRI